MEGQSILPGLDPEPFNQAIERLAGVENVIQNWPMINSLGIGLRNHSTTNEWVEKFLSKDTGKFHFLETNLESYPWPVLWHSIVRRHNLPKFTVCPPRVITDFFGFLTYPTSIYQGNIFAKINFYLSILEEGGSLFLVVFPVSAVTKEDKEYFARNGKFSHGVSMDLIGFLKDELGAENVVDFTPNDGNYSAISMKISRKGILRINPVPRLIHLRDSE